MIFLIEKCIERASPDKLFYRDLRKGYARKNIKNSDVIIADKSID